jgi:hypothetical protein
MPKLPLKKDLRALFIALKHHIDPEYPEMDVTIGADETGAWSYQTGDNSFTGGAYHYPHWAVVCLTRRSNSSELADEVRDQLAELMVEV